MANSLIHDRYGLRGRGRRRPANLCAFAEVIVNVDEHEQISESSELKGKANFKFKAPARIPGSCLLSQHQ